MVSTRLGEGLTGPGKLRENAIRRTLAALDRIEKELAGIGVTDFRAVGTEALRLAENRENFLRKAAGLGVEVEIISGEEEARLIRRGAFAGLPPAGKETLLADPGGGSTELIPAGPGSPVSLPLGAVRLKERFSPGRDADPSALVRMREYCRSVLEDLRPDFPPAGRLVGLGGTFTTLAAIRLRLADYEGEKVHGFLLAGEEIDEIYHRILNLTPARRHRLPGLEPSRADIILPGTVIVQAIVEWLGLDRVTVSDRGLLFGLLEDQVRRLRGRE